MSAYKNIKRKNVKSAKKQNIYFATKSKNEIYYQMASILREVTHDKKISTQKVFIDLLAGNSSKSFLGNQL